VLTALECVHRRSIIRQPNCTFNADANAGHGFAMASIGAIRASRYGAG